MSARLCPRCGDDLHAMDTHELVEVDFCGGCHGIYFDAHETAVWLELTTDLPALAASLASARPTTLSCPSCFESMEEIPFHPEHQLRIDRCPKCAGVFFDAKEIPKAEAIARTVGEPTSKILVALKLLGEKGYSVLSVRPGTS